MNTTSQRGDLPPDSRGPFAHLPVISKPGHDIEQFLERDEAATECDFVIVNGVRKLGHFRTIRAIAVTELAAFGIHSA